MTSLRHVHVPMFLYRCQNEIQIKEVIPKLGPFPRLWKEKTMQQAIAKEKLQEDEVGTTICPSPGIGQEIVAAYIVGELSEEQRRAFAAHLGECGYCLEQIVLWHMAEVSAEAESKRRQSAQTA